jgi:hypothetical protein
VVALPIIDDLQPPHQGHHGVHQKLNLPKSRTKRGNFSEKLTKFDQNCSSGLGVTKLFKYQVAGGFSFFHKKSLQKKFMSEVFAN